MRNSANIMCVLVVMGMTLLSCDGVYREEPLPAIVGRWSLVEQDGLPVPGGYVDYYDFFENGEGLFSHYDFYGRLVSDPFVWEIRRYGELCIRYMDYGMGTYFYYFDCDGPYLYLSGYPDFYYYDTYARIR